MMSFLKLLSPKRVIIIVFVCIPLLLYKKYLRNYDDRDNSFLSYVRDITNNNPDKSCGCLLDQNCFNPNSPYFRTYSKTDAQTCFHRLSESSGGKSILAMVGDSRMRGFFVQVLDLLGNKSYENFQTINYIIRDCKTVRQGKSFRFQQNNITVTFYWRNRLNQYLFNLSDTITSVCKTGSPEYPVLQCPLYVLADIHAHEVGHCNVSISTKFSDYNEGMLNLFHHLENTVNSGVTVVYKKADRYFDFLFDPPAPNDSLMKDDPWKTFMDSVRSMISEFPSLYFWSSSHVFVEKSREKCVQLPLEQQTRFNKDTAKACGDGVHHTGDVIGNEVQVLMNFMCNKIMGGNYYCSDT